MSAPEALRRQEESRKEQEMPLHESPSTKMQMLQLTSRHLDELKPLKEASKSVDQVVERKRPRTRSSARLLKDDSTRVLKEVVVKEMQCLQSTNRSSTNVSIT